MALGPVGRRGRRPARRAGRARHPPGQPTGRRAPSPRPSSPRCWPSPPWSMTWLESRRITGHLNRTIDRLIEAESRAAPAARRPPEAVMSVDDHGIVRGANAQAAELVGQPVDDLVGRRLDGLVESSRLRRADVVAGRWPARRAVPPMSLRVLRADAPTATLVEATSIGPAQRRRRRSSGCATSPSARSAVRRWSRPASRFQQAFHSAPTGMALVRMHDSTILDANRSLADMLDRPVGQLVGRSIRDFTHPDDLRSRRPDGARLELDSGDTLPARPALPAQRRRVRVGAHPRRGDRGQRRGAWRSPTSRT